MTIDVEMKNAQSVFAVANTPLFLVRKLREDPDVRALANSLSGDDLLRELETSTRRRPETIREAVIPYVCLVALSFCDNNSCLKRSLTFQPQYEDEWFDYIRGVLIQTYCPTYRHTTRVPHVDIRLPDVTSSSASERTRAYTVPVPQIGVPQITSSSSSKYEVQTIDGREK